MKIAHRAVLEGLVQAVRTMPFRHIHHVRPINHDLVILPEQPETAHDQPFPLTLKKPVYVKECACLFVNMSL